MTLVKMYETIGSIGTGRDSHKVAVREDGRIIFHKIRRILTQKEEINAAVLDVASGPDEEMYL